MTEIEKLIAELKRSTDHRINKRILREKIQTDLHLTHNGGLFKITPELIGFLQSWPIDDLYLEDVYQNPVQVDKQVFLIQAQQHYHMVMNRWHQEYAELKKLRKI